MGRVGVKVASEYVQHRETRTCVMASSVASAKEMERWRREREQAKATAVEMPETARNNFHAMKADMVQLEKFERKVHQLVDRQEAKER